MRQLIVGQGAEPGHADQNLRRGPKSLNYGVISNTDPKVLPSPAACPVLHYLCLGANLRVRLRGTDSLYRLKDCPDPVFQHLPTYLDYVIVVGTRHQIQLLRLGCTFGTGSAP